MPVAPCAFPVHLKDISHPGEVSRQSCTYWSCLLISNCLPKVLKFWEMLTDLPALWECKKQLKVNTDTAQAVSFVRGGNPVQFSSRGSWTPTSPTPNSLGQDRTSLSELPPCAGGKNYFSSWLQLPISTVQILSSNSLLPFSFFFCQGK